MSTIGQRIKKRRIDCGLTVDQLAEKLNKSRATIYRYESSEADNMPISILEPLANELGTTPAELMGWTAPTSKADHSTNSPPSKTIGPATKKLAGGTTMSGVTGMAAGAATMAAASVVAGNVSAGTAAVAAVPVVAAAAMIPAALFGILSIMSQDELDKVESFAKFLVKDKKISVPESNQVTETDDAKVDSNARKNDE